VLTVGTPNELKRLPAVTPAGTRRVELTGADPAALLDRVRARPTVCEATIFGEAVHALASETDEFHDLTTAGVHVRETRPNLEDVFVTLSRATKA
jgi:hypothetical protein